MQLRSLVDEDFLSGTLLDADHIWSRLVCGHVVPPSFFTWTNSLSGWNLLQFMGNVSLHWCSVLDLQTSRCLWPFTRKLV